LPNAAAYQQPKREFFPVISRHLLHARNRAAARFRSGRVIDW